VANRRRVPTRPRSEDPGREKNWQVNNNNLRSYRTIHPTPSNPIVPHTFGTSERMRHPRCYALRWQSLHLAAQ